ncbi:MAG: arginase family protein [Bacteroidetes bacterium]|jgi:arginase family enzyme|nr:arginase family protein [Bacteroidota bacterium]
MSQTPLEWNGWEEYFSPVSTEIQATEYQPTQMGNHIQTFYGKGDFPDLSSAKADVVLVGCGYDAVDLSASMTAVPDAVRKQLYDLHRGDHPIHIADLGNVGIRSNVEETCLMLGRLFRTIIEQGALPVLIGGGAELGFALYRSFTLAGQYANYLDITSRLPFQSLTTEDLSADNVLGRILGEKNQLLFHYCILGYQTYFNSPEFLHLFKDFHFDLLRLGEARENIRRTEPLLRDAHLVNLNMGSVKAADAPNTVLASPNGWSSDEICRLARYAGLSHKLRGFCLSGLSPDLVPNGAEVQLAAQVIWHLIEGVYVRKPETLMVDKPPYIRFTVEREDVGMGLHFYKNTLTDAWWMGVPIKGQWSKHFSDEEYLVPCGQEDYIQATTEELPQRWLRRFQKLNE